MQLMMSPSPGLVSVRIQLVDSLMKRLNISRDGLLRPSRVGIRTALPRHGIPPLYGVSLIHSATFKLTFVDLHRHPRIVPSHDCKDVHLLLHAQLLNIASDCRSWIQVLASSAPHRAAFRCKIPVISSIATWSHAFP
jgi:hypothetical protein